MWNQILRSTAILERIKFIQSIEAQYKVSHRTTLIKHLYFTRSLTSGWQFYLTKLSDIYNYTTNYHKLIGYLTSAQLAGLEPRLKD
jgi:hypothetical protein